MSQTSHCFAGQHIIVTAAAAGIGRAIAIAFAAAGGIVHGVDIDKAALAALQAEYPNIHVSVADVANEAEVARIFTTQQQQFGALEVLVNCAGIAGPTALLEDIALPDWHRTLAVNLDATFLCTRQAIKFMRPAHAGCLINISSSAGWHGYPLRTPYACAKWALIGLTKSLAMELGAVGIRVNAICPGSVDGERMTRVIAAEAAHKQVSVAQVRKKYTDGVSLRTFVQAEDVAASALFLASSSAAKITGQSINVDGNIEYLGSL